jgi:predicted amidohydrolase
MKPTRREFICKAFCGAAGAALAPALEAATAPPEGAPQRVTLAQVPVTEDVAKNLEYAHAAFEQAGPDGAQWIFFPEMFISGYYGGFHQEEVARAFEEICGLCRRSRINGLISTGWKEDGKTYDQIRIVNAQGECVSIYAKRLLCYGESYLTPGETPLVHTLNGIKFGTLICNDLWVTPGYSDGPDPHLSLQIARAGAQVIFQAVNSGSDQRYRSYHESNQLTRAAEAKCPLVAVNAFEPPEVNDTSGVVGPDFKHLATLPRDRVAIETVEFTPAQRS